MTTRSVVLTCALLVASCAGSDTHPAQDPTSTAARSDIETMANSPGSRAQEPAPSAPMAPRVGTTGTTAAQPDNSGPSMTTQTTSPDNTRVNERDRHDAVTPMAQGSSREETNITATIRKGLMADKGLSFTAKNVKVITVGSKVTLRGPVNSEQEKATVEAIAKQTPGVVEVDDQLEVKK